MERGANSGEGHAADDLVWDRGAHAAGARPLIVPTLIIGVALVSIATLAVAALPGASRPEHQLDPLALWPGEPATTTRLSAGLAGGDSSTIGAADRRFGLVRHGSTLVTDIDGAGRDMPLPR